MTEEKHYVKKAIIMAAGMGKRMQPLSFDTPKPLIKVHGTRMIDSIVDGLNANGITNIFVVVGYKKELFEEWAKQYPEVMLIENQYYATCNNISSLYVARKHLDECIIIDGDQIICNYKVLEPDFSVSGYNVSWCNHETNEWLLDVEDGIIKGCSRFGGMCGWRLYSISRWTKDDGEKLRKQIEYEFEKGNTDIYWDDVPIFCYPDQYTLGVYKMDSNDVIEIDNLTELSEVDEEYKNISIKEE